ncbi:MAG: MBL fold metallo-hydrolase [Acutalibacter sp.]|nr:MBL fold metallo-hydrolase [Acutalibacter sp.]
MKKRRKRAGEKSFGWLLIAVFACFLLILAEEQGVFDRYSRPESSDSARPSAAAETEPPEELEVYFLDVGQGDSELIRIPDGDGVFCALIDTGEYEYADRLTDALRSLGVERIDALICSHPHTDHMGCMARIVQRFDIGTVYMPRIPDDQVPTTSAYEALLNALEKKKLTAVPLRSGTEISCPEGAEFHVLAPEADDVWEGMNNYSGVIRLIYGDTSFLFTGDAEKQSESKILKGEYSVEADVLKCGHHGSRTSTSAKFLKAVDPEYAVISCGKDNSYGHPHEETLEKLNMLGTSIYRTDTDKTVLARSDGMWITFTTGLTLMEEE